MKSSRLTSFFAALASAFFAALFAAVMAIAETNTLASVALSAPSFGPSANMVWDRNGRYGVFASLADNLVPGQGSAPGRQVFLYDRTTGAVKLVSHVPGSATTPGNRLPTWFQAPSTRPSTSFSTAAW